MVYTVGVERQGNSQTSCPTAGQIIRDLLHCVSRHRATEPHRQRQLIQRDNGNVAALHNGCRQRRT